MPAPTRAVVFVHGLWMTGYESIFLRRELQLLLSAQAHVFSYRTVVNEIEVNAAELRDFLRSISATELHLVGHSLGGLVILKCLEDCAGLPPGRVVLLGSPVQGSQVARELARVPLFRAMIGKGMQAEMQPPSVRRWEGRRELGLIAGDLSLGLGRLIGRLAAPNDGTVLVEETLLEGAHDSIILPVSHTGMVFSRTVASQTAEFLRTGKFARA